MTKCLRLASIVLSLTFVLAPRAGAVDSLKCEAREFATSQISDIVRILGVQFSSSYSSSRGILRIKSTTSSRISDYLFILEFLGADENQVASVAAFKSLDSAAGWVESDWLGAQAGPQGIPLLAGQSVNVAFESPVVPQRCPSSARIAAYYLKVEDGTTYRAGFETARPSPVLIHTTPLPRDLLTERDTQPLIFVVEIDSDGRVVRPRSEKASRTAEIIRQWRFSSYGGRPLVTMCLVLSPVPLSDRTAQDVLPHDLPYPSEIVELIRSDREWRVRLPVGNRNIGALQ